MRKINLEEYRDRISRLVEYAKNPSIWWNGVEYKWDKKHGKYLHWATGPNGPIAEEPPYEAMNPLFAVVGIPPTNDKKGDATPKEEPKKETPKIEEKPEEPVVEPELEPEPEIEEKPLPPMTENHPIGREMEETTEEPVVETETSASEIPAETIDEILRYQGLFQKIANGDDPSLIEKERTGEVEDEYYDPYSLKDVYYALGNQFDKYMSSNGVLFAKQDGTLLMPPWDRHHPYFNEGTSDRSAQSCSATIASQIAEAIRGTQGDEDARYKFVVESKEESQTEEPESASQEEPASTTPKTTLDVLKSLPDMTFDEQSQSIRDWATRFFGNADAHRPMKSVSKIFGSSENSSDDDGVKDSLRRFFLSDAVPLYSKKYLVGAMITHTNSRTGGRPDPDVFDSYENWTQKGSFRDFPATLGHNAREIFMANASNWKTLCMGDDPQWYKMQLGGKPMRNIMNINVQEVFSVTQINQHKDDFSATNNRDTAIEFFSNCDMSFPRGTKKEDKTKVKDACASLMKVAALPTTTDYEAATMILGIKNAYGEAKYNYRKDGEKSFADEFKSSLSQFVPETAIQEITARAGGETPSAPSGQGPTSEPEPAPVEEPQASEPTSEPEPTMEPRQSMMLSGTPERVKFILDRSATKIKNLIDNFPQEPDTAKQKAIEALKVVNFALEQQGFGKGRYNYQIGEILHATNTAFMERKLVEVLYSLEKKRASLQTTEEPQTPESEPTPEPEPTTTPAPEEPTVEPEPAPQQEQTLEEKLGVPPVQKNEVDKILRAISDQPYDMDYSGYRRKIPQELYDEWKGVEELLARQLEIEPNKALSNRLEKLSFELRCAKTWLDEQKQNAEPEPTKEPESEPDPIRELTPISEPETSDESEEPSTEPEETPVELRGAQKGADGYYPIDLELARSAHENMSFREFNPNQALNFYRGPVENMRELAEKCKSRLSEAKDRDRIDGLLDSYERKLANWVDRYNRNGASCPSVMVSGAGNFPVRKKEQQIRNLDKLMKEQTALQTKYETAISGTGHGGISSDDNNAVAKLEAKLYDLQQFHKNLSEANKYFHKNGRSWEGYQGPLQRAVEKAKSDSWDSKRPFYTANVTAEIRRLKGRIEELKKKANTDFGVGWNFDGGHVIPNKEENRIEIYHDEKPDRETIDNLKRNGFRWSPRKKAWQRMLNSEGIWAAKHLGYIPQEWKPTKIEDKPEAPFSSNHPSSR